MASVIAAFSMVNGWSALFESCDFHRTAPLRSIAIGSLYSVLSILFFLDELGKARPRKVKAEQMTLFAPPPR